MRRLPLNTSRRRFLQYAALGSGSVMGAATLALFNAHNVWAAGASAADATLARDSGPYRPLRVVADSSGRSILALPAGFDLVTFAVTGEPLVGGAGRHARNADGMAAFPGPAGTVRLIRNQELRNRPGDFTLGVLGDAGARYDAKAMGGTTTIDYDPIRRRAVREFFSLNGTYVNCAGGLAYRDAGWLSCEETTEGPREGWGRKHGYVFLVSAAATKAKRTRPFTAMGRFAHEAAVADPRSGIVYLTEDAASSSGFYRFVPKDPMRLAAGGTLQMLKVEGRDQYDARSGQAAGRELRVGWVTIGDPDPDLEAGAATCFAQGHSRGGARFFRLEGIYRGRDTYSGSILFVSTTGGDSKSGDPESEGFRPGYGQLWRYTPAADGGRLALVYESTGGSLLDSPDNLCVTPRGGVLFCEDDASGSDGDTHPLAPGITNVNRLIGLTRAGAPFTFAVNVLNNTEFAGACFSPDGSILFVNIYGDGTLASGMTCAITGPWAEGPL
jgi:secreted PhoX family phosphatase